jgi:uncharacterized protein (DUF1778 family)
MPRTYGTQRPRPLSLRLTEREDEELRQAAEMAGLSLAEFSRRAIAEAVREVLAWDLVVAKVMDDA